MGLTKLESERLIFKEITIKDAEEFYNLASNPKVAKYLKWEEHKSLKETKEFIDGLIKDYELGKTFSWGIYEEKTRKLIGWIGLVEFKEEFQRCEIGYWLGEQYWKKGYMTEALSCITEFCFKDLNCKRVQAKHAVENIASGKVMLKSGFEKEGILRNYVFIKNRTWNTVMYSKIQNN